MSSDSDPAIGGIAVTPHDSTVIAVPRVRGLWVGGAGNLSLLMGNGTTILLEGVLAGSLIPVNVKRVNATNTTATLIVALY